MPRGPFAPFLHYVRSRRRAADADAELLARFAADRDDDAFAELVRRHGPLVWGIARQVLGHDQDAEDAFQATFVLLARKAGSIRSAAAVAGWLHGTAWRVATKARTRATVRRERERSVPPRPNGDPAADVALRELQALLHAEIAALPAKYRTPFVLCVLEGRGRTAVARSLGWNEGTLSTRLAWARQRLRSRLLRCGVDVGAALAAVEVTRGAVPAVVARSAVTAARTGIVSATVTALAHGGFMTTKYAPLVTLGLVVSVIAIGSAGLMGSDPPAASETPRVKGTARVDILRPPPAPKAPTGIVTVTGTATGPDGKPVNGADIRLTAGRGHSVQIPIDGKINVFAWTGAEARLAVIDSVKTDERGQFQFEKVGVPVFDVQGGAIFTTIMIFAKSPSGAMAWSEGKSVIFRQDADHHATPNDQMAVDLHFDERTTTEGRVFDESEKSVKGARVRLGSIGSTKIVAPTLDIAGDAPASLIASVATDEDGRFEFVGLPRDLVVGVEVEYPDHSVIHFDTATPRDRPIPDEILKLRLFPVVDSKKVSTPHRVLDVRVLSAATDAPLAGVEVTTQVYYLPYRFPKKAGPADGEPAEAVSPFYSTAVTDKAGSARLRHWTGQRAISVRAPADMNYVAAHPTVSTLDNSTKQQLVVRLTPCCRLQIQTADADNGTPLSGIFICRTGHPKGQDGPASLVQTGGGVIRLADGDEIITDNGVTVSPFTDHSGKVHLSSKPGPTSLKLFGTVQKVLPGDKEVEITEYDLVKGPKMPLDLKPGGDMTIRFELRKKGPPRREPYKPVSY